MILDDPFDDTPVDPEKLKFWYEEFKHLMTETKRFHPKDDPGFRYCNGPDVWYLSHPLAPDGRFSFQQNMDHVVILMRIFFDHDVHVIAPYHTACLALDDERPEHRRMGLECDCKTVKLLGRIILSGHRLSTGMECEKDVILDMQGRGEEGHIWNLIGVPDKEVAKWLKLHHDTRRDIDEHQSRQNLR
jgi:hypothetical protein